MKVVRIEYMLGENNWKCCILAKDVADGIKFLEGYLKAEFRVTSTEEVCEVHGVSTNIISLFGKTEVKKEETNKTEIGKRGPGRPPRK